jgi:serine/threonine protein kinase
MWCILEWIEMDMRTFIRKSHPNGLPDALIAVRTHRHSKMLRFFMLCSAWRQPQSGGARLCSGVPQKLFYQLTAAVAHCHGQNVIHRECA